MRDCAPLYISVALESFSTFVMGLVFLYLLLLITNKGRLLKPGQAFMRFVKAELNAFFTELKEAVGKWRDMPTMPLEDRFATCRKTNQAVCSFQLVLAALTISRWLHIGNVNGFRYLGYAVTCPPMQAQLILLIAPIVPGYRVQIVCTYVLTTVMELSAWAGSLAEGALFENMEEAFATGDLSLLVPQKKFYAILPGVLILIFLLFVQIPYLQILFCCRRHKMEELGCPPGYIKLLVICQVTWLAFPCWWLLGFEGLAIIQDTKMNAVGFAALNVVSKASFTVHMIGISGKYRHMLRAKQRALERRGSKENLESDSSSSSEQEVPPARAEESWLVRVLRPYDESHNVPSKWTKLEAGFRAFLLGRRVTPCQFDGLSPGERSELYRDFLTLSDDTHVEVAVNDMYGRDEQNSHESREFRAQSPRSPINPRVKEDAPSPRLVGGGLLAMGPLCSMGRTASVPRAMEAAMEEGSISSERSNTSEVWLSRKESEDGNDTPSTGPEHERGLSPHVEQQILQLQELLEQQGQKMEQMRLEATTGKSNQSSSLFSSTLSCIPATESKKTKEDGCMAVKFKGLRSKGSAAKQPASAKQQSTRKVVSQEDIMLGQRLTTATGLSGRVVQKSEANVVLMTSTGALATAQWHEVTVLMVTVVGARGLFTNKRAPRQGTVFSSVEIVGKPCGKVQTDATTLASQVNWGTTGKLMGYALGEGLGVNVYASGEGREQVLLGSATISAEDLDGAGFEGELLLSKDGHSTGAYVTIMVMAIGTKPQRA